MSEQKSNKANVRVDDNLKHELGGVMSSGHQTHAEEWRQVEPSGDDQPDVDRAPNTELIGGTPDGISAEDVQRRSELASYVSTTHFPVVRSDLVDNALDRNAPDWVLGLLRNLPEDKQFENLAEIWSTLGGGEEAHRF